MALQNITFGEYLNAKREEKNITLRELARKLDVSAPFLRDVEMNRRAPLTPERLEKLAEVLTLTDQEKAEMYDLVGKQKGSVAPDLPEYIMERDYVSAALRTARDLNAGEAEWAKFVEDLKRRR